MNKSDGSLLIIEDESDLLDLLEEELQGLGGRIYRAQSAEVARAIIESQYHLEQPIDAVVSDINMPKETGLELLEDLRRRGFHTPFVYLTAYGDKGKLITALRLGAFDFLEKPYDPIELRAVVKRALEFGTSMRHIEEDVNSVLRRFRPIGEETGELIDIRARIRSVLLMRKTGRATARSGS